MLVLGINTAAAHAEIALIETRAKSHTLFFKSWISHQDESQKVLPVVRAALKKGVPDKIFIVSGPGAFTGLRIGVTIANTLAFIYGVPIINADTFEYLRARIPDSHASKTALLLKAGGEFAAVLLPRTKKVHRLNKNELADFFKRHKKIKYLVGDMAATERKKYGLPAHLRWLPEKSLAYLPEVMQKFFTAGHTEHKIVKPHYLLPPKITQSKKTIFV